MDWLMKLMSIIFGLLVPPPDSDPQRVRNYRWLLSSMMVIAYAAVIVMVLLALGKLPYFSGGVAWAVELRDLRSETLDKQAKADRRVRYVQILMLQNALKQDMHDICSAIQSRNQAALDAANRDFEIMGQQYNDLSGKDYARLPCDVVLISAH